MPKASWIFIVLSEPLKINLKCQKPEKSFKNVFRSYQNVYRNNFKMPDISKINLKCQKLFKIILKTLDTSTILETFQESRDL